VSIDNVPDRSKQRLRQITHIEPLPFHALVRLHYLGFAAHIGASNSYVKEMLTFIGSKVTNAQHSLPGDFDIRTAFFQKFTVSSLEDILSELLLSARKSPFSFTMSTLTTPQKDFTTVLDDKNTDSNARIHFSLPGF
jgi:hypothetical protein